MLRVLTDDHDLAMSLDDLALFADLFNGRFYLHGYQPFLNLFRTPGDTTLIQIVNRDLNGHAVTGQYLDLIHAQSAGDMSRYDMLIGKLYLEGSVGKCFHDRAFKFYHVILWHNISSYAFVL